ncbi:hypothetical protein MMC21_004792 [Puttea exsequens]|nr:hypothetical protein [Puttea exsequens]
MDLPPPLTISILAYFTFVFTLSFTPPFSHVRLAIFALMLSYIPLVLWPSTPSFSIPLYTSLAGGSVFSFVLQFMDQIVLGQWSSNVKGPNCARGGQQPTSERTWAKGEMKTTQRSSKMLEQFYWANTHVFDSRFVNTLWEVANVPPFSQYDRQQVPTKIQFLRKNSTICLVCFLLLDLTRLLAAPPEQNAILFAEERVGFLRRLGEVSAEELILRFVSAGMYWAITFLLFQGVHSGTGVLMVGLGISEVEMWRPFFGRLQDAWSLRQFWG